MPVMQASFSHNLKFIKRTIMLRNYVKLINTSVNQPRALFNTSSINGSKWDLLTAVYLERKPIITPLPNDIQKEYKEYLAEVEFERSLKNDHEMRHIAEMKQLELLKAGKEDIEVSLKQTAQDFLDASLDELSKFKFGSRTTDDDKKNNLKSLNRKLDKHLVLLVNQKIGDKKHYILPQGIREEGETLRQTAERIVKKICGDNIKVQIFGNAPCGFYKYKYPKQIRENGPVGAKVFIYFARYLDGSLPAKDVEYKWLDQSELQNHLTGDYKSAVMKLTIDE